MSMIFNIIIQILYIIQSGSLFTSNYLMLNKANYYLLFLQNNETILKWLIQQSVSKHNYNFVLGVLRSKDQSKITGQKPAGKKVEKAEPLKGDLNGDGKVNVSDVELLAAHVKGKKILK